LFYLSYAATPFSGAAWTPTYARRASKFRQVFFGYAKWAEKGVRDGDDRCHLRLDLLQVALSFA